MNKLTCDCVYSFTRVLYITCDKNTLIIILTAKIYKKSIIYHRLACRHVPNVMYVSINKQLIGFQNCFSVLSRLRQGKVKRHYWFPNNSGQPYTQSRAIGCPRARGWAAMIYSLMSVCGVTDCGATDSGVTDCGATHSGATSSSVTVVWLFS
jgi:hypothetical protein